MTNALVVRLFWGSLIGPVAGLVLIGRRCCIGVQQQDLHHERTGCDGYQVWPSVVDASRSHGTAMLILLDRP
jgi:hypothetical protein